MPFRAVLVVPPAPTLPSELSSRNSDPPVWRSTVPCPCGAFHVDSCVLMALCNPPVSQSITAITWHELRMKLSGLILTHKTHPRTPTHPRVFILIVIWLALPYTLTGCSAHRRACSSHNCSSLNCARQAGCRGVLMDIIKAHCKDGAR